MKVGVIGCGYWGPNLIRTLIESNRCSDVYCHDPARKSVMKVLLRYPSLKVASNIPELIKACDAVMIATPASTHYAIARDVLLAGKSVFVEKPLTDDVAKSNELVLLADQTKQVLMPGHTFVYSPPVRKVKRYIADGVLGEIFFLSSSRVNLGLHRPDVNVIWDLAPHDVSIFINWLGETPLRVSAVGRACVGKQLDVASLHLEFPCGTMANIEVSWLSPSKLRRTVVVGSRKMVVYDDTLPSEKVKLYDRGVALSEEPVSFGQHQLTYRDGDMTSPFLDNTEPLMAQTNQFLDCVLNGSQPESNGRFGVQVVATVAAACRSAQQGGTMVKVEQPEVLCGVHKNESEDLAEQLA